MVKRLSVLITAVALVLGMSLPLGAAETSGSASVGLFSNYVWRGFKLSESAVVQPSVGITYDGFGANLWANYDTDTNELNETDLTLDYAFSYEKFSFDVGYIYYALDGIDDTQEIYLSVGYDILLSPTLTVYYDIDEGDGAFFVASIGHSLEVSKGIDLSVGASASYNANSEYSIGDYSAFHNGELSVSLSIPLWKAVTLEPLVAFTFPLSDKAEEAIEAVSYDEDSSIFYGGVTLTLSF